MKHSTRHILLAAVLATPLAFGTRAAHAQYQVNHGNANDANNLIGSGGANGTHSSNINTGGVGNLLITNDVTGGRGFQGNVPYFAPGAFHGNTGTANFDRFTAGSSSAYSNNAQTVKPYFSQSQYGNQPPQGFVADPKSPGLYTQQQPQARESSDARLGVISEDPTQTALPRPGELGLPSQVDPSNINAPLNVSAITGNTLVPAGQNADDASALSRFSNMRRPGVNNRLGDDQTVQSMRDELNKNIISDNPADNSTNTTGSSLNGPDGGKPVKPVDPNNLSAGAKIDAPFESPTSTALANQSLTSKLPGSGTLDNSIKSDQSTSNRLLPAPAEQSTQYGVLADRFQKLQSAGLTDQEKNDKFTQQFKQRQADAAKKSGANFADKGAPGGPLALPGGGGLMPATDGKLPTDSGSAPAMPDTPAAGQPAGANTAGKSTPPASAPPIAPPPVAIATGTPPASPAPASGDTGPAIDTSSSMVRPGAPLMITSLTDGMKQSRLRDLLATAEDEMRQQKYTSALDQYDLAERVVPNNPMIALGRANAELGASYYARADNDIRRALTADTALMLGQFNLQKFIGVDRVTFLVKDLKDIASTEPTSVRAPFLLAYIMYNSGDRKMASNYLALSEQRAGKADPLYKQLRVYWDLPAAEALPAPDAGK